jgi:hypothetical protein
MRVAAIALVGTFTTLSPAAARADEGAPVGWRFAAGVGTDFPVAVNARVQAEAPFRLRLSSSVGYLPGAYVSAINAFVIGVGGYTDATGDLVKAALSSSLVWRTHAGLRPFRALGLYGEVGYGLVALGGSATASELIAGLTGHPLPANEGQAGRTFDATAALHMLDAEVGWEWPVAERLALRAAVGGAFTVASRTSITPSFAPRAPRLVEAFANYGEDYLDDVFTSYVFTPVLGASGSYRF